MINSIQSFQNSPRLATSKPVNAKNSPNFGAAFTWDIAESTAKEINARKGNLASTVIACMKTIAEKVKYIGLPGTKMHLSIDMLSERPPYEIKLLGDMAISRGKTSRTVMHNIFFYGRPERGYHCENGCFKKEAVERELKRLEAEIASRTPAARRQAKQELLAHRKEASRDLLAHVKNG